MGPRCAGGKETSLAFASATFVISEMNPGCAAEQHAWREVKDGWRPLYGDVDKIGVAIEWHDFRSRLQFCPHRRTAGAIRLSLHARRVVRLRNRDSSR